MITDPAYEVLIVIDARKRKQKDPVEWIYGVCICVKLGREELDREYAAWKLEVEASVREQLENLNKIMRWKHALAFITCSGVHEIFSKIPEKETCIGRPSLHVYICQDYTPSNISRFESSLEIALKSALSGIVSTIRVELITGKDARISKIRKPYREAHRAASDRARQKTEKYDTERFKAFRKMLIYDPQ